MAEQVTTLIPSNKATTPVVPASENPYVKEIKCCGVRPCMACAGTGNAKFPKGGETTSSNGVPYPCKTCKGTARETYFETKPNPWYGKEKEMKERAEYEKFEKRVAEAISALAKVNNLPSDLIKEWQKAGKGLNEIMPKSDLLDLMNDHMAKYGITDMNKVPKQNCFDNVAKIPALPPTNHLAATSASVTKQAITTPVASGTFTRPPPQTYDHIPNLNKPQGPLLTIKPVKWESWCSFESDNGGFVDIMGRQGQIAGQLFAEADRIRFLRRFSSEYRKYAEHCKAQGVKPDPIPYQGILAERLRFVELSDGERIYNSHYEESSGCVVM